MGYPSEEDKAVAKEEGRTNLGGDIFIHGKSVTIGCIPLGDTAIEEVFALTVKAGVDNCRVLIAPYDFRKKALVPHENEKKWVADRYKELKRDLAFYSDNLKEN